MDDGKLYLLLAALRHYLGHDAGGDGQYRQVNLTGNIQDAVVTLESQDVWFVGINRV